MSQDKKTLYVELAQQAQAIVAGETDKVANMANISALIYWALKDVNWAGFYLIKDEQLVLGPFHGKPACIRIPIGTGVCGTAAAENKVQLIQDVHQFSGHIACDAASNSEIVIPINLSGNLFGVLDLDSPLIARFDSEDLLGLTKIVEILQVAMEK
ncbi:GAF domain-containing protein [Paraglaciecola aquimarina]|uniref:GAF domain-containing protein n=1 Tax=Paraglaciecola algarum TaxID=3050085 RepID=A0ABS9D3E3_9ALTE|nr:GAF domain-containing protein [Paraglaciecola sp. G1-23]MCF2947149.1 GAF domain-containing protein [Paraglaciecola sp. G1-23]